ncbi:MAG: hypothetical protein Q4A52_01505 [Bacillota bacterium]|nr:hypothetical protein [Bacillota bacterium]
MTLESVLIFPLVAILIFTLVFSVSILSIMIFHQNEIGLRFLMATHVGSSLNGKEEIELHPSQNQRLTGVEYQVRSRSIGSISGTLFSLYKANRMTAEAIDRLLHGAP